MGIQEDIARVIDDSGLSLYRIAKDLDMDYATLHRFYHGKVIAWLDTADPLADYFDLQLQPGPKGKKKCSK